MGREYRPCDSYVKVGILTFASWVLCRLYFDTYDCKLYKITQQRDSSNFPGHCWWWCVIIFVIICHIILCGCLPLKWTHFHVSLSRFQAWESISCVGSCPLNSWFKCWLIFPLNMMNISASNVKSVHLIVYLFQISIAPDVDHSKRWKTRTVLDCKSPVFNETFMLWVILLEFYFSLQTEHL